MIPTWLFSVDGDDDFQAWLNETPQRRWAPFFQFEGTQLLDEYLWLKARMLLVHELSFLFRDRRTWNQDSFLLAWVIGSRLMVPYHCWLFGREWGQTPPGVGSWLIPYWPKEDCMWTTFLVLLMVNLTVHLTLPGFQCRNRLRRSKSAHDETSSSRGRTITYQKQWNLECS